MVEDGRLWRPGATAPAGEAWVSGLLDRLGPDGRALLRRELDQRRTDGQERALVVRAREAARRWPAPDRVRLVGVVFGAVPERGGWLLSARGRWLRSDGVTVDLGGPAGVAEALRCTGWVPCNATVAVCLRTGVVDTDVDSPTGRGVREWFPEVFETATGGPGTAGRR